MASRKRACPHFPSLWGAMKAGSSEVVSQSVIPAKPREVGREPGSRSFWSCSVFLDSGTRDAQHRSSGMTVLWNCDTVSLGPDSLLLKFEGWRIIWDLVIGH
jgi:hypothetical protein